MLIAMARFPHFKPMTPHNLKTVAYRLPSVRNNKRGSVIYSILFFYVIQFNRCAPSHLGGFTHLRALCTPRYYNNNKHANSGHLSDFTRLKALLVLHDRGK
jgi:hypothetical protein